MIERSHAARRPVHDIPFAGRCRVRRRRALYARQLHAPLIKSRAYAASVEIVRTSMYRIHSAVSPLLRRKRDHRGGRRGPLARHQLPELDHSEYEGFRHWTHAARALRMLCTDFAYHRFRYYLILRTKKCIIVPMSAFQWTSVCAEEPVLAGGCRGPAHRRNNGAARPVLQAAAARDAVRRRARLGERHAERAAREELRSRPEDECGARCRSRVSRVTRI